MNTLEDIQYRGHRIRIAFDDDPQNPRTEWDNLGNMAYKSSRYILGDEEHAITGDVNEWLASMVDWDEDLMYDYMDKHDMSQQEMMDHLLNKFSEQYIWLPTYAYIHGGVTMSTGAFSCAWDSSQVGIIFVSKEVVRSEYGWKRITEARADKIREYLNGEVETFNEYCTGQVFGFVIDDYEHSCWGFYGGSEYCLDEAKSEVDAMIKWNVTKHIEKMKQWITSKVPLIYRKPFIA